LSTLLPVCDTPIVVLLPVTEVFRRLITNVALPEVSAVSCCFDSVDSVGLKTIDFFFFLLIFTCTALSVGDTKSISLLVSVLCLCPKSIF